eukprot:tig00021616_g22923.t1
MPCFSAPPAALARGRPAASGALAGAPRCCALARRTFLGSSSGAASGATREAEKEADEKPAAGPGELEAVQAGSRSRKVIKDPNSPASTSQAPEHTGSIGGPATRTGGTRYPLVFAHGLLGFDTLKLGVWSFQYWRGILEALREAGCDVYVTSVPPAASIERRAMELRARVKEIGAPRVNIIAHSMGGLDSRYFISRLDGGDLVSSLTTIATPHRGSAFADWCMERRVEDAFKLMRLMETGAGSNLTTAFLREEFNPSVPDHPDVKYFSYGAAAPLEKLNPVWRLSARIIEQAEGPNDGLVSVESARWGEYQGTIECDHLQLLNWAWTNWRGLKFDGLPLYRQIADKLAESEL